MPPSCENSPTPRTPGEEIASTAEGQPAQAGDSAAPGVRPQLPQRMVGPIAFGTILQPLNSSMIAVALVGIQAHFGAGPATAWLVSGLYLATAVAAPAAGRLADTLGPRKVSLAGLALVALASIAAPFAPSVGVLVACRVVIGIGTAAQYPCGLAMVRRAADRMRADSHNALAALTVCSQVMVALGPTLGGVLVGGFGWSGIFWANVPLTVIGATAILLWAPADPKRESSALRRTLAELDLPGMLLFVAAMGLLMYWLLSLAQTPLWWALGGAVAAGLCTVWRSLRAPVPFLDLRLLSNRDLSFTYVRTIATYTAYYGIFYGLPQWLEESRDLGASGAGLVMLPLALMGIVSTLTATRVQKRRGPGPLLLIGSAVLAVGGLLLTLPTHTSPVWLLVLLCLVLGIPNGYNSMANQNAVYEAAPAAQAGAAGGLYRTAQYVGANLAAAMLALLIGTHSTDGGLHHTGLAIAAISGCLAVAALGRLRRGRARGLSAAADA
ncbi:MFS transporter [Streptomyces sp. NPDC053560]|uniref:MFS transporter n=1 Tax=Streptomyces sp. NPDC053560 TaxID=3365711 RepID=UPI0037CE34FE